MPRTRTGTVEHSRWAAAPVAGLIAVSIALSGWVIGAAALSRGDTPRTGLAAPRAPATARSVASHLGPVFEPNVGQTALPVRYVTHSGDATVFLTPTDAVWSEAPASRPIAATTVQKLGAAPTSPRSAMGMHLVGAQASAAMSADEGQPGVVNYFIGSDPASWRTHIPTYARVTTHDVYPGIDLVWYGSGGALEYDFVVSPAADPSAIRLAFDGVSGISIDGRTGDLVVQTPSGSVRQHAPNIFQDQGSGRVSVPGSFVKRPDGQVGFEVGGYDHNLPLDIDPSVVYSTLIGGSGFDGSFGAVQDSATAGGIAVDAAGDSYVVSSTTSPDFPVTSGAYSTSPRDMVVLELNPTGTGLIYATYVGGAHILQFGTSDASGFGIAVDGAGNAVVAGETSDSDWPTTPGAVQTTPGRHVSAFLTRLSPGGSSLDYSTYLGSGSFAYWPHYDAAGNVVLVGVDFISFPTLGFCTDPSGLCSFVAKVNSAGSALSWVTSLPNTVCAVPPGHCALTLDSAGNVFVASATTVMKLDPSGSTFLYNSNLLNGAATDMDGIVIDGAGNAFVAGSTTGGVPVTPGAPQPDYPGGSLGTQQSFVAELDATGSHILYATYYGAPVAGGNGSVVQGNVPGGIALTPSGDVWITGWMFDPAQFPSKAPIQEGCGCFTTANDSNPYVAKLRPAGGGASDLLFSTLIGGDDFAGPSLSDGLQLDPRGNVYITGWAQPSGNGGPAFPTTSGAFQRTERGASNLYVAKLSNQVCDAPITGVVSKSLEVKPGQAVCIDGATIKGNVVADAGSDLSIYGAQIVGNLKSAGAAAVTVCSSTINGTVSISGTKAFTRVGSADSPGLPTCLGNTVGKPLSVSGNLGGIEIGGNTLNGGASVSGNTGAPFSEDTLNPEIEGNSVTKNLTCSSNTPAPTSDGQPNTVTGKGLGQCSGL